MLTFYANSVEEAYKKMKEEEWINEINSYIVDLNGVVDGKLLDEKNILELFELDAYDVYVSYNDLKTQSSRLAKKFKNLIITVLNDDAIGYVKKDEVSQKNCITSDEKSILISAHYSFSQNIRILRKHFCFTQAELGSKTDVEEITIRSYEAGRRLPTARNLCLLAEFFNVNPTELLGTDID